jgi:hypothetical protein
VRDRVKVAKKTGSLEKFIECAHIIKNWVWNLHQSRPLFKTIAGNKFEAVEITK